MPVTNPWQSRKIVFVRRVVLALVMTIMLGWFWAGMALFPDGPIEPCDPSADYLYTDHPLGYCGKQGQSHTFTDFTRFKFWESVLMACWPLGIIAALLLGYGLPGHKRADDS